MSSKKKTADFVPGKYIVEMLDGRLYGPFELKSLEEIDGNHLIGENCDVALLFPVTNTYIVTRVSTIEVRKL